MRVQKTGDGYLVRFNNVESFLKLLLFRNDLGHDWQMVSNPSDATFFESEHQLRAVPRHLKSRTTVVRAVRITDTRVSEPIFSNIGGKQGEHER